MANSYSASFPEIWAREQQRQFYKVNVAMEIADTSFVSQVKKGDTLNRPYRATGTVQAYTRGTAITIDDKTDTNEQLSINRQFATGFYEDDFDSIQNNYNAIANYAKDNGVLLSNIIDSDVLGEYSNATSTVDAGTVGGTSGNGIALTTSNVLSVVSAARKKLAKLNIPLNNLYGVVSPDFEEILVQYGAGRDTKLGDDAQQKGYFMDFYGFKLYSSNQTAGSAVLALATQPTNNDTVVIDGVTFTFVSTIGTTAGNVLIGANVDATRVNLTALINDPTTTSATQVALSTDNARKFTNQVTATDSPSADTMTVVYKGVGTLTVSETLTDATDEWTAVKQKQHNLFGAVGAPTLLVQSDARVRVRDVQDKLGKNILNGVLYGVKTFADQAKMMVNVEIKSSGF